MNLVVGNAKPALPHGGDGRCEQTFAAALRPDLSSVHGDSSVLGGCWGFFSLSPLLPLYREGCYLVKIKCLSIITLVCVNYSWGS